nr:hypothetical protein [uncultured Propionivibrio sp.]
MQTPNQPQTTINSTERDASVQIGVETKSELIRRGLVMNGMKDGNSFETATHMAFGALCSYAEMLTSTDRRSREWAKKELRKAAREGAAVTKDEFADLVFKSAR